MALSQVYGGGRKARNNTGFARAALFVIPN